MDFDEDSDNPEAERSSSSTGNVGFIVDGIDVRDVDVDEIEFLSESDLESFEPGDFEAPPLRGRQDFTPPKTVPADDGKKSGAKTAQNLPPLWPQDLDSLMKGGGLQDKTLQDFFAKNVVRQKSFKITGSNMLYYPQLSFGYGVKYGGNLTISQTAMLILASAKTESLRSGRHEIGCEQILLALVQNHGFAAGQLILSLHLNAIGKPYALGDMVGTVRRVIEGPKPVAPDTLAAIARGAKHDMYFSNEADEALIQAMYMAAQAGCNAVSSKHLLAALVDCDNEDVQAAFGSLFLTKKEIKDALAQCPESDDLREFMLYTLSTILYAFIRFRLFQKPVRRYQSCAIPKDKALIESKRKFDKEERKRRKK